MCIYVHNDLIYIHHEMIILMFKEHSSTHINMKLNRKKGFPCDENS